MLARTLSRTRDELLDSITAEDYGFFYACYEADPWDERRADMRAARTTAMIAWVNGNKDTRVVDFMPYEPVTETENDDEDIMSFVDRING